MQKLKRLLILPTKALTTKRELTHRAVFDSFDSTLKDATPEILVGSNPFLTVKSKTEKSRRNNTQIKLYFTFYQGLLNKMT